MIRYDMTGHTISIIVMMIIMIIIINIPIITIITITIISAPCTESRRGGTVAQARFASY